MPNTIHLLTSGNPDLLVESLDNFVSDIHRGASKENWATALTTFVEHQVEVFLFNTQLRDLLVMDDVSQRVLELKGRDFASRLTHRISHSVSDLMATINEADIVVPTRFHGSVLSVVSGRPAIGICYYRKAAELIMDVGQEDCFQMLDDLDPLKFMQQFGHLKNNLDNAQQTIRARHNDYVGQLEEQYQKVLGLVTR